MLVTLALSALAACSGDDGGGDGNTTPKATPRPPAQVYTDIPNLDQALDAALKLDVIELAGLTGYQRVPCEADPAPDTGNPVCRPGEEPGTEVEVLPVNRCNRVWLRPEGVPEEYTSALGAQPPELIAVYRPRPLPLMLPADHIAVIERPGGAARTGAALWILNGRVVAVEWDCGNFAGLLAAERVDTVVYPRDGVIPTSVSPTPSQ